MRGTASALGLLLPFAGLAVGLSGCEVMPDPEFAALKSALTLSITEAKRSPLDGSVDFHLELRNGGSTTANACPRPPRRVFSVVSSSSAGSRTFMSSTFVDHAGCAREFAIESGGVMSWNEALKAPPLSEGRVEVEVDVQIVNPRRCGRWGNCAAIDLKSNTVEIP